MGVGGCRRVGICILGSLLLAFTLWSGRALGSSPCQFTEQGEVLVPSDAESVLALSTAAHKHFESLLSDVPQFLSDKRGKFAIVLEELLSNVVRHAHYDHPEKTLYLRLWRDANVLRLVVADQSGTYFNPHSVTDERNTFRLKGGESTEQEEAVRLKRERALHDPTRPDGQGGRGVLLVEGLTDFVGYEPNIVDKRVVGTLVRVSWIVPEESESSCAQVVKSRWSRFWGAVLHSWGKAAQARMP